ncbi:hypothetical protein GOP47_0023927 [Adiantum capillus-veneris]|uniref:Pentatricopeptide repeat-containing protein n=1 Tax=Adiantum capillus-veneris TaxID=13818 RepID=A0A9D4U5J1_ADICA|nr:hypothetical protein GOP47_0023927 [Adiantum capillus-veneris]
MPFQDTVSWTSMVVALYHNEKYYEALCLYDGMQGAGVGPNNMAFVPALNACPSLQALEEGQSIQHHCG